MRKTNKWQKFEWSNDDSSAYDFLQAGCMRCGRAHPVRMGAALQPFNETVKLQHPTDSIKSSQLNFFIFLVRSFLKQHNDEEA